MFDHALLSPVSAPRFAVKKTAPATAIAANTFTRRFPLPPLLDQRCFQTRRRVRHYTASNDSICASRRMLLLSSSCRPPPNVDDELTFPLFCLARNKISAADSSSSSSPNRALLDVSALSWSSCFFSYCYFHSIFSRLNSPTSLSVLLSHFFRRVHSCTHAWTKIGPFCSSASPSD